MSWFGVLLGVIGTALTAFVVVAIYLLDPLDFITVPLQELYDAPNHDPMYGLTAGWAVLAVASVWGVAVLEGRLARRRTEEMRRGRWPLRAFGAAALLGGVTVSSLVPGLPIGLGFITDAEFGGYFTGDGSGLMTGVWAAGLVAATLGLLGLATTKVLVSARPR